MIVTSLEEFTRWLQKLEDYHLEFKKAENDFSRKELQDYCAALANEGGGRLILGVNPRGKVVGTRAFDGTYNTLPMDLLQILKIRIDVEELHHPNGRVLIFHIPSHPAHPVGQVVRSSGKYTYPMRVGQSLVEMDPAALKKILTEADTDFSSKVAKGIDISSLDELAVKKLRNACSIKTQNQNYLNSSTEQFLKDLGLLKDRGLTFASLILLGRTEVLKEILPESEIVFEWRQVRGKIAHDFRKTWLEPIMKVFDDIWSEIDKRNLRTPFQEGFFQREIFSFDQRSIREAILNAVAHRDYVLKGQVIFINASPDEFIIESPGGFLPGITPENAIYKRAWRNKLLAEVFEKAGLIERSGQGLDIIFEKTIRDGKGTPDFSGSDEYVVQLKIPAKVKDSDFILFLEKVTNEKQINLSFEEIYELERVRELQAVSTLKFKDKFLKLGLVEKVGATRGAKYILSSTYYHYEGKPGIHTKLKGLSRNVKKELILNHVREKKKGRLEDFVVALELKQKDISNLLQELKREKKIKYEGSKKAGFWKLA